MAQIESAIAKDALIRVDISKLNDFQGNLKDLSEINYQKLRDQILRLKFSFVIHAWENDGELFILDGHQRVRVLNKMREEGFEIPPIPVVKVLAKDFKEAKEKVLAGTSQYGEITSQGLYEFIHEAELDFNSIVEHNRFTEIDFNKFAEEFYGNPETEDGGGGGGGPLTPITLADKFLVPPFSVLDARQGYWKQRKKQWLAIGIKSEVGREGNLLGMSETMLQPDEQLREITKILKSSSPNAASVHAKIPGYYYKINAGMTPEQIVKEFLESGSMIGSGTSIFDPVLCEIAYRWFSPVGGNVVDPFAGGSVRGIVASKLGRNYFGGELRKEQVEANRAQAKEICSKPMPRWECADSRIIDKTFKGIEADLVFSCPPYADLEVYSDDPQDISTLEYKQFVEAYREIIKRAVSLLKNNRFAVFVIGEVREKKGGGFYRGFVVDTIKAFEDAGARFYNEMLLLSPAGTLALRAGRAFSATRKVGKTHQNILVFCKGDPTIATKACGEVDMTEILDALEAAAPPDGEL